MQTVHLPLQRVAFVAEGQQLLFKLRRQVRRGGRSIVRIDKQSGQSGKGRNSSRSLSWFAVLKKRHPMRSEVGCGRVPENRPLRKTGKHIFYTELYTGQNKAAAMEANSLRTHQKVSSISRPPGQIANLAAGAESAQRVHHIIQ